MTRTTPSQRSPRPSRTAVALIVMALALLGSPAPVSAAISGFNIVPANLAAGASGSATISFTVGAPIPVDGRVVVTFPAGYTVTSSTVSSGTINGGLSVSVAGQVVTVVRAGNGTASSGSLSLLINGVQNPPQSGNPGNATITTQDGVLATIETLTDDPAGDVITPGVLTVTSVDPGSLVTNAISTATVVNFTTANTVPLNGKIEVTFPAGYTFGALVATSSSIGGTLADAEVGQVVTITRSAGSPVSGALQLSFTTVRSPLTAGNPGVYQIRTLTSTDVVIDQDLAVSGDTVVAAALTGTNVAPASLVAGAVGNATVTFNPTNNSWPNNGRVAVTLPSGFATSSSTAAVGNLSNGDPISVTGGAGTNTVTLTRGGGSALAVSVSFTISNVTNPAFTGSTGSYGIVTQDSTGAVMAQDLAVGADVITAGVLTGTPDVQPASLVIGKIPDQAVSFTTANPIPANGKITVTFGAGFALGYGGQTVGVNSFNLPGSLVPSVVGQTVTLALSGVGIVATSTAVSFNLTNIRNPLATGTTGVYAITTTQNDGTVIDSGAPGADTIAAGGATFTATNVEPASMVTGSAGSVTTTFTIGSALPSNGAVRVIFPAGFTVGFGGSPVASSPTLGSGLSVAVSGQQVTVTRNGLGTDLLPGSAVSLTLTNIRNPTVPGATAAYTITTLTSLLVTIETDAAVAADTMTPAPLTATNVQPASLQAGAVGSVFVTFTMANPFPAATGSIVITFPSGFTLNSGGTTDDSGDDRADRHLHAVGRWHDAHAHPDAGHRRRRSSHGVVHPLQHQEPDGRRQHRHLLDHDPHGRAVGDRPRARGQPRHDRGGRAHLRERAAGVTGERCQRERRDHLRAGGQRRRASGRREDRPHPSLRVRAQQPELDRGDSDQPERHDLGCGRRSDHHHHESRWHARHIAHDGEHHHQQRAQPLDSRRWWHLRHRHPHRSGWRHRPGDGRF